MNRTHRLSEMDGLGDMSWGAHFCLFYETRQDLLETLAHYFETGLTNNEFCLWITSSSGEKASDALRQVIPSAGQRLEKGDIEIISSQQWYLGNDEFDSARVLQAGNTKIAQALEKGYARIRLLADAAWLGQELWRSFSEYEGKIDEHFAGKPISIICAYRTASLTAADVLDVARTHRYIAAKRRENWEILESPDLKRTKTEAERLIKDKVQEQTADLHRMTQALQAEIIEHKRIEDALRESEKQLSLIYNSTTDYLVLIRVEEKNNYIFESCNEAYLRANQAAGIMITVEQLAGMSIRHFMEEFVKSDQAKIDFIFEKYREAITSRNILQYDEETRLDGVIIYHETTLIPILDTMGQCTNLLYVSRDITEHKRAEEALRESEKLLQLVLATLPVGVAVTDPAGNIILTNPALKRIWGNLIISSSERWARSIGFWHDSGKRIAPQEWASLRALSKGETSLNELIDIETFDGAHKTIQNSSAPIQSSKGVIVGAVIVNEDVTERKRAEEALRTSERVLREAESLGQTGSWEQDLVTGETFNSEANLRLFFGDDRLVKVPGKGVNSYLLSESWGPINN